MVACLLPFGVWAVIHLPVGSAGVHEWLPEGREERLIYDRFVKAFGNDQVVLVSWDGCSVEENRLVAFRKRLEDLRNESEPLLASIDSTDVLVDAMTRPPLGLSRAEAFERLQGFLVGKDGTAAILLRVTDRGVREQAKTIESIYEAADSVPNLGRDALRMVGTVFECYAVDQYAEDSLTRLVPPSSIIGLVVAWLCLRRLRYAIAVLVLAAVGQITAVGLVYYSGYQFSAVLIVLPTLVFMLTLSGAVHLINYYRDSLAVDAEHASARAVALGWKPCILSSVTTVLGMGSLLTSQLAPIREFGLFSAIALAVSTFFLLLMFPAVVAWIDFPLKKSSLSSVVRDKGSSSAGQGLDDWLSRYVGFLSRNATLISIASVCLLLVSFFGLSKLRASTKFTDMFPLQSRVNQDMFWIEEHVGPISTVEVLLQFSNENRLSPFERIQWVARIGEALREQPDVGAILSPVTFLPSWSEGSSIGATAKRSVVRKAIDEHMADLREQKWIAETDGGQLWRIIAKVSATSRKDYGEITLAVNKTCQETLQSRGIPEGLKIHCTGLTPIMHETQVTLLQDLGYSFLTAFLLITPIMMWIARGWRGGLLAMVPNVLPVSIVFGTMGWLGYTLDIAGILTASVALGIAVDDTLHFLCWYMNERKSGDERLVAVRSTFKSCSAAMLHTTLISCLSMAPFLFAGFLPTQQFAKLMIAMLSGAIIGDLLILPALLLSPWGAVIRNSQPSNINS